MACRWAHCTTRGSKLGWSSARKVTQARNSLFLCCKTALSMCLTNLPKGSLRLRAKMMTVGRSPASQMKQCDCPRLVPVDTTEEYGPGRWLTFGPDLHGSAQAEQAAASNIRATIKPLIIASSNKTPSRKHER